MEWPLGSPDLTTIDFLVWSHLKNIVYATAVTTAKTWSYALNGTSAQQIANGFQETATTNTLVKF